MSYQYEIVGGSFFFDVPYKARTFSASSLSNTHTLTFSFLNFVNIRSKPVLLC